MTHGERDTSSPATSEKNTFIRFLSEDKITPRTAVTIISAATELYVKAWLAQQGRLEDMKRFDEGDQDALIEEAGIRLTRGITPGERVSRRDGVSFLEISIPASHDPKVFDAIADALTSLWGEGKV